MNTINTTKYIGIKTKISKQVGRANRQLCSAGKRYNNITTLDTGKEFHYLIRLFYSLISYIVSGHIHYTRVNIKYSISLLINYSISLLTIEK